MHERPILFSAAMVRAIVDGRKTQTRRVVKLQPRGSADIGHYGMGMPFIRNPDPLRPNAECPYGQPGDRLWVRETWMPGYDHDADHACGPHVSVIYRADNAEAFVPAPSHEFADRWSRDFSEDGDDAPPWRPSIHMPRWACRLVLEITDVRVERLQDGDGETSFESRYLAEGVNRVHHGDGDYYYSAFRDEPHPKNWGDPFDAWRELWTTINGQASWDADPWVWVITFKRITP